MSNNKNNQNMRIYIISALFGIAAGGLSLLLFAGVIRFLQLSAVVGDTMVLLAFAVSCLTAGIAAGRLTRRLGLVAGVKSALLLLALYSIVTLFMGNLSGEFVLGRLAAALLCGAAGGVIGINKR